MTVLELIQKYDGDALISISKVVEGGKEFIVDFDTAEVNAIKADITALEVVNFAATFLNDGKPVVKILAKTAETKPTEGTDQNS